MVQFKLEGEYIELFKLLKTVRLAQTGGHAKLMIDDGLVKLNGGVELRKRAKIRCGDIIECEGTRVEIS